MVNANPQPGANSLCLYDALVNLLAARRRKQAVFAELAKASEAISLAEADVIRLYLADGTFPLGSYTLLFKAPDGIHYVLELDCEEMVVASVCEANEVRPWGGAHD
jgi:hypothetical protein